MSGDEIKITVPLCVKQKMDEARVEVEVPIFVDISKVIEAHGVPNSTIYNWIKNGLVETRIEGGKTLVDVQRVLILKSKKVSKAKDPDSHQMRIRLDADNHQRVKSGAENLNMSKSAFINHILRKSLR